MEHVPLAVAFAGGLLSFVSPCVLPLIPGYLSFVSGVSVTDLRSHGATGSAERWRADRRRVVIASVAFVVGFSLVFVGLGASATIVGRFLLSQLTMLGRVAGVVLILFGLHTMGVLRVGWLNASKRVQTVRKPAGPLGALVVGLSFAFGWTPCIGPILAGILTIAAGQESVGQGVWLLTSYSAGLAVPFLLTALAIDRCLAAFAQVRQHFRAIEVASGLLLVAVGALVFTDRLTMIARYLSPFLPSY